VVQRVPKPTRVVVRRADRPGDLGWVVMAHGEVYAEQFGWDTDFEVLVARIVADYAHDHDPEREAAWIAELDGERAGCIFLVAGDQPDVARLRILLVAPAARGLGVGTRLVEHCLGFAREAGYRQVTLWTNDVLVSARRIYEAFGFTLTEQEPHHSFGHDLVGQNWTLDLHHSPAG
jgi:GNAT superfamily N-acetyltransferase